ncbi:DUF2589 domain-containing protein [Moorena producens JHB]|uniref:DUF2589 domain-containing protein n=1 Tax=Moorena producens (strain JHB) TaxID=1454205 RepID=A0A1D9G2F9_MOOP1|nr:DUF2589 domain-containing protein [Moorena producens]AOY81807.1 DUF2589 domain-containing protein [Moorena producens JHB]
MIKFDAFINAIHTAILSANDSLIDKNLDILENFFEVTEEESEEFQSTLDEALAAVSDVLNQERAPKQRRLAREKLVTMRETLEGVRSSLSKQAASREISNQDTLPDKLKPKMTTIQFPEKTASGVVMSDVRVPLITLVPLSMTQVSEVKFRTELEIQSENDELLVSFPSSQSTTPDDQKKESSAPARATLEITLTPHHGTEGLKKIVEGYEKVLRAQIPH